MITAPVLIIGCPRSGTSLLYNILSEAPELWSIGYESKGIIERYHHPAVKNWASGELSAADLTPTSRDYMLTAFQQQAAPGTFWRRVNAFRRWLGRRALWQTIKQRGRSADSGAAATSALPQQGLDAIRTLVRFRNRLRGDARRPIRLLEKTPENCLRLPFLLALFPDARILYLVRDGRTNVNSLIEGWRHPHLFPGYQVPESLAIPGDSRGRWAFTLIPGWRELTAAPLEEICAWQWMRCNEAVLAHQAETAGTVPYLTVHYEELVTTPAAVLPRIADFLDIGYANSIGRYATGLPLVNVTSTPGEEKWRRQNGRAIERILPLIKPMMDRLGYA